MGRTRGLSAERSAPVRCSAPLAAPIQRRCAGGERAVLLDRVGRRLRSACGGPPLRAATRSVVGVRGYRLSSGNGLVSRSWRFRRRARFTGCQKSVGSAGAPHRRRASEVRRSTGGPLSVPGRKTPPRLETTPPAHSSSPNRTIGPAGHHRRRRRGRGRRHTHKATGGNMKGLLGPVEKTHGSKVVARAEG